MGLQKAKRKVIKKVKEASKAITRVQYYDDRYYKIKKGVKKVISNYYPSVTTILDIVRKPYIENWKASVGFKESSRTTSLALAKGSNVHFGLETILEGGICVYRGDHRDVDFEEINRLRKQFGSVYRVPEQEVYLQINRGYQFIKTLDLKVVNVELIVYHDLHEYAGTLDLIADVPESGHYMINGAKEVYVEKGRYLIDWKTGKNASSMDYPRQLSAYYTAYMRMNKIKKKDEIKGAMLVHTNAQTKSGIVGLGTKIYSVDELEQHYKDFRKIHQVYLIENPTPTYKELDFPEFLTLTDKDPYQMEML